MSRPRAPRLGWVAEQAPDPAYQAIARLRLAAELLDAKAYDEALKQLDGTVPKPFEALVADRRGDIYQAQGKRGEAREAYRKAWIALGPESEYRRLVEIKLNAVGLDPSTLPAADKSPSAARTSS